MQINSSSVIGKLDRLSSDLSTLLVLAHQLGKEVEAVLNGLKTPASNGGIDSSLPAGPLADAIWQQCGRHKALVTRTRLSQRAADEDGNGYRRRRNGNDAHSAI